MKGLAGKATRVDGAWWPHHQAPHCRTVSAAPQHQGGAWRHADIVQAVAHSTDPENGVNVCQAERRPRRQMDVPRKPQQLTKAINNCSSCSELLHLVACSSTMFNHIHVTAMATRMADLLPNPGTPSYAMQSGLNGSAVRLNGHATGSSSEPAGTEEARSLVEQAASIIQHSVDKLDTRGMANCLWALAKAAAVMPAHGSSEPMLACCTAAVMSGTGDVSAGPCSSNVSSNGSARSVHSGSGAGCITSLSTLRSTAAELLQRAAALGFVGFSPQHLSNTLWSAATLQLHLTPAQAASLLTVTEHSISSSTGQGLANMLWACVQLGIAPPTSWLARLYAQAPSTILGAGPQALSNMLWALAVLRDRCGSSWLAPPTPWLRMLLADAQPVMAAGSPQAQANTVWAVAQLGCVPPVSWLRATCATTLPALARMEPQQLSSTVWGMLQLATGQGSVQVGLPIMSSPQPAVSTVSGRWLEQAAAAAASALPHLNEQGLANTSLGLAQLGWKPGAGWASQWLAVMEARRPALGLHALSSCIAAASTWVLQSAGQQQPLQDLASWLDAACMQLAADVQQWAAAPERQPAKQLQPAHLFVALRALSSAPLGEWQAAGCGPGVSWLVGEVSDLLQRPTAAHLLSPGERAAVCWVLARLQHQPGGEWLAAVMLPALRSQQQLSGKEAAMLWQAADAWGLDRQAATILVSSPPSSPSTVASDVSSSSSSSGESWEDERAGSAPGASHAAGPGPSSLALALVSLARRWRRQVSGGRGAPRRPDAAVASMAADPPLQQQADKAVEVPTPVEADTPYSHTALALLRQAAQQAHELGPVDLCQCLSAAASLGFKPYTSWKRAMLQRTLHLLHSGQLQATGTLPMAMLSLAQLGVKPRDHHIAAMMLACVQLPASAHASEEGWHEPLSGLPDARSVCSLLGAVAAWDVQPSPAWWSRLLLAPGWKAAISGGAWSARDLGVLVHALLKVQALVPPAIAAMLRIRTLSELRAALASSHSARSEGQPPPALTVLAVLLARTLRLTAGSAPGDAAASRWVSDVVPCVEQLLPGLPLPACATLLSALGSCQGLPSSSRQLDQLLDTFQVVTMARLAGAPPSHVCGLLRALTDLGVRPEAEWAQAAVGALARHLDAMRGGELVACAVALADARVKPGRPFMLALLRAARQAVQGTAGPGGGGLVPGAVAGDVSELTSALMRLDPAVGRRWLAKLVVVYG